MSYTGIGKTAFFFLQDFWNSNYHLNRMVPWIIWRLFFVPCFFLISPDSVPKPGGRPAPMNRTSCLSPPSLKSVFGLSSVMFGKLQ